MRKLMGNLNLPPENISANKVNAMHTNQERNLPFLSSLDTFDSFFSSKKASRIEE